MDKLSKRAERHLAALRSVVSPEGSTLLAEMRKDSEGNVFAVQTNAWAQFYGQALAMAELGRVEESLMCFGQAILKYGWGESMSVS